MKNRDDVFYDGVSFCDASFSPLYSRSKRWSELDYGFLLWQLELVELK
jgi:hypothetical protein